MIDRNLSFSQIKYYHECPRRWGYKFADGYKPKQPPTQFMRGSLIHLGMEHFLKHELLNKLDWWQAAVFAWKREWESAGEVFTPPGFFEDAWKIVVRAVAAFQDDWEVLRDPAGFLLVERWMYMRLPGWRGLVFIPDVICRRRTGAYEGGIFVVDFKSWAKVKVEPYGEMDLQGAIYQKGAIENGYPAIGTALFQINSEVPKVPRTNKDGTPHAGDVASAARWSAVKGELVTLRSEEFLDGVWNQVVLPTAEKIAAFDSWTDTLATHMDYYRCNFCEYRNPCFARLQNLDEVSILAEQYNKRGGKKDAPEKGPGC